MLVVMPLTAILCVEFNVVILARVSDVRAAQQLGALVVLPFAAVYVAAEVGLIKLDLPSRGVMSGILWVLDVGCSSRAGPPSDAKRSSPMDIVLQAWCRDLSRRYPDAPPAGGRRGGYGPDPCLRCRSATSACTTRCMAPARCCC